MLHHIALPVVSEWYQKWRKGASRPCSLVVPRQVRPAPARPRQHIANPRPLLALEYLAWAGLPRTGWTRRWARRSILALRFHSVVGRGAATRRRGLAASSPLPHLPVRHSRRLGWFRP